MLSISILTKLRIKQALLWVALAASTLLAFATLGFSPLVMSMFSLSLALQYFNQYLADDVLDKTKNKSTPLKLTKWLLNAAKYLPGIITFALTGNILTSALILGSALLCHLDNLVIFALLLSANLNDWSKATIPAFKKSLEKLMALAMASSNSAAES